MKNTKSTFDKYESSARTYCRTFPVVFSKAQGARLFDENGNQFIDFLAGAGALNFGHNCPIIKQGVIEYLEGNGLVMALDLHSTEKRCFIDAFQKYILKPRDLSYKMQFTSPTGTSVIESAVKLAKKWTKRETIVSFTNGFHGMTGLSLSLTGSSHHRQATAYGNTFRLPYDGYLGDGINTMAYFRKLLEDKSSGLDLPAAVVVETLQGEGGLNTASIEWLQELRSITEQYGILLIVDEVQSGCGRTGKFFSFERASIKPDLVCLSKSIGGMGLPFALLLTRPDIDIWQPGEDNGTFRGNNLAFVASRIAIEHYWATNEFELQVEHKAKIITEFLSGLKSSFSQYIGSVKGIGIMQGIEFLDPEVVPDIINLCFGKGLIIESCGNQGQVLKIMAPLIIDEVDLLSGLKIIEDCISSYASYNSCTSNNIKQNLSLTTE
ncbi:diaminobutyrate--2-oxoglutarate transaminase [Pseudoalteromonas luteoviolacea]|uniref:diaminobutyrate--2-oxoglutarate transaminase n=1 Tax=Pseudoalteromonas luteoviolacea TaxID=43657 RepID=UPI00115349F9|nr:diaminobutyrate--2-oxoglutarate transaminase [Pseudoalteromonas luteoviolacea]TQF71329.1 diaminobutyrate--2-oxoglutarate transaminase [Pseudoalteromonas luteoviolacea]